MSNDFILIDAHHSRHHGWRRSADFRFTQTDTVVPLLLAELSQALPLYPLAFKEVTPGAFQLVAILGLQQGCNLFVDLNGQWRVHYIPSPYRAHPFALMKVQLENGNSQYMIGFDQRSGLYRETPDPLQNDQRFFDDEGQLQPAMQQVSSFLVETAKNRDLTQTAVTALSAAKLLEPWTLPEHQQAEGSVFQGLYRINAAALKALPGNVLEILSQAQALELAYAQLFSMSRLALLRQFQQSVPSQPQTQQPKQDLSQFAKLLEERKDDTLSFEWMK